MRQKILHGLLILTIASAFVILRASSNGIKLRDISVEGLLASAKKVDSVSNPYQKCICPPKKIIFVGGIYSKDGDPMERKVRDLSHTRQGDFSAVSFDDGSGDTERPGDVKKAHQKTEQKIKDLAGKDKKQSILVIGYSAGASVKSVVERLKKEGYCVDFLALDPPFKRGSQCASLVPPIPPIPLVNFDNVGNQWRNINNAICDANLSAEDGLVWTGGNAEDQSDGTPHNPTNNPDSERSRKIFKDMENKIAQAKKCPK